MDSSLDASASPPRPIRTSWERSIQDWTPPGARQRKDSQAVNLVSRMTGASIGGASPNGRKDTTGRPMSLVPRTAPGSNGVASLGASNGGSSSSPQKHAQPRAVPVPVSTTVVQDGVKWVNLVRFVNLARLFTPCLRQRTRRRVRFGGTSTQRPLLGDKNKGCGDAGASAAGGAAGTCGNVRPIYIQVRQGRQLVWPTFEGVDHSCFCVLLVNGQTRGATQAVAVSSSSSANSVQWNEVFSFPRSSLEGASSDRVLLQVWSSETYGDDVLVGQADLLLGPLLEAENPQPITTVLELQAIDDYTGQVEAGSCGELVVAAWMEPDAQAATRDSNCQPSAATADLHEAGVVTSNISAPCGSKSMPQVVHSPLGTLYEEPCIVILKLSVVGLVDLNYDLLSASAQQGGLGKRRVRMEGVLRTNTTLNKLGRREGSTVGATTGTVNTLATSPSMPMSSGHESVPFASPSMKRGISAYVEQMKIRRRRQRMMRELQTAQVIADTTPTKPAGALGRGAAAAAAAGGGGWLKWGMNRGGIRRQKMSSRDEAAAGVAANLSAGDELMEEEDEAGLMSNANATSGGGGDDGRTVSGVDDTDDGASSLALNPTAPLSVMGTEDQGPGGGPGQGQGVFCYFKMSVDKHSEKSRLRWLSAPSAGLLASQLMEPTSVTLQPSVFVFALARPLPNAPVGLALYATSSAKRRGRVVGRVMASLYDLLDHVLGSSAVAGPGGPGGRPDMGVSGKPVEVTLPFEEPELGAVRLIVQMADLDERAMLFRMPLVSDPQQLMGAGDSYDTQSGTFPYGPSVVPVDGFGAGGAAGAGAPSAAALGPVLGDTALLTNVIGRSGVEADVEHWFLRSYARVGNLKVAGALGYQDDRAVAKLKEICRSAMDGRGGGGSAQLEAACLFDGTLTAAAAAGRGGLGAGSSQKSILSATAFRTPAGSSDGHSAAGGPTAAGRDAATAAAGAGAAGSGPRPQILGSLILRISSINSSGALAGTSCCCVVKCGPHWLRTADRVPSAGAGTLPQWQVVIPIYNPATVLTVGIFSSSAKSVMGLTFSDNLVLVSRVRLKLCSIRPFRRTWHVIAMYLSGAGGGGGNSPPLVGVLGVKLQYGSLGSLAASYLKPPIPDSLYELELEGDAALAMEGDARKISEKWLASAQPPIPPEVARLLLDDGRTTFKFQRIKTNWRRVKAGLQLIIGLNNWFKHICSWKSRRDSWEVVFCIALLCYLPSTACKLFFFMIALRGIKAFRTHRRRIAALADSGADAAAAALLIAPAAAVAAASGDVAAAAAAASGGAKEPAGTIGGMTIGGGFVEADESDEEVGEDSKVPVGTVAEFRRKFAELIELGLLLQNLFDDVASILERLQAVLSFQDVVASCLFIVACILLVFVVALLGFPTTIFVTLLWQVRPPSLRDPLPPPPFNYFMKLPCKSAAEFG